MPHGLSDSDCDDVFSSEEHKDMSGDDRCQYVTTRKKRRGVIEKRRRDRINNSLSELRRLVPTAFEKQGSAKLEKAEILQMTVDHLRLLHAKGLDALAYDPHKFAMDYHSIGFRECASEVSRYMVAVEGMDVQDPMRMRLMSHLQCFAAQRELANKQASTSWGFGSSFVQPPPATYNQPSQMMQQTPMGHMKPEHQSPQHTFPTPPMFEHNPASMSAFNTPTPIHHHQNPMAESNLHFSANGNVTHQLTVSNQSSRITPLSTPLSHTAGSGGGSGMTSAASAVSPVTSQYQYQYPPLNSYPSGNQVKPYRPWGTELAY